MSPPVSMPVVIATGCSRPSDCLTITTERLPVVITASEGTTSRDADVAPPMCARINMPGVSLRSLLSMERRACNVRLPVVIPEELRGYGQ